MGTPHFASSGRSVGSTGWCVASVRAQGSGPGLEGRWELVFEHVWGAVRSQSASGGWREGLRRLEQSW